MKYAYSTIKDWGDVNEGMDWNQTSSMHHVRRCETKIDQSLSSLMVHKLWGQEPLSRACRPSAVAAPESNNWQTINKSGL